MADDDFKLPVIDPKKLKPGDKLTIVVMGPNDDKSLKMTTFYPADVMVVAYEPAPPVLEPRCDVEFDHPDGPNGRMVGTVIAMHADLAWVEHRVAGHGLYHQASLAVIREAKK